MRVVLLGINHRTAPVDLREQLAVNAEALSGVLDGFRERYPEAECVLLSTCNRTELYVARPAQGEPGVDALRSFVAELTGASLDMVTAASIHREQEPAVHHLFRVTAGLDAMAVGETQVLGQVRRAYEASRQAGAAGPTLHRIFQRALSVARQAHRASGVDQLRQSVSSMAVEFAGSIFESFHDKTVAGIGAGEITKATLRQMLEKQPGKTWVVNRTAASGLALADTLGLREPRGGARPWEDLDQVLIEADVVLTGTAAAEPVITAERFKPLLKKRRHRPLFLIDLAVPRDVEPTVGTLPNVYLFNIDDLNAALAEVPQRRERIEMCEGHVRDAAAQCMGAMQHQDLGVLIKKLRHKLQDIGEVERSRTQAKIQALHTNGQYEQIQSLMDEHTHRLINKILHLPLSRLNGRNEADAPLGFYAAAIRRLFELDDGPEGADGQDMAAPMPDDSTPPSAGE